MEWIIVPIILIIILSIVSNKLDTTPSYAYTKRQDFLSPAERSFYGVLLQSVPPEHEVMSKVRIADVLQPKKGTSRKHWQSAFNKISAKHFDFVICSSDTMQVVAAIELDDKSHSKKGTKARDKFIEQACTSAELPLIRFPARGSYVVGDVQTQINASILVDAKA